MVGIILSILKMYTLTCSEHSRKNGKTRVQTQVFLILQIFLGGFFTSLKKKLGRHGKCSIQLNSVHFELLIHLNVNYLNFKVRQTDLFLIMCPSVSFLTALVSLNILVSKIFVRTMKWDNVFKHLVHICIQIHCFLPSPSVQSSHHSFGFCPMLPCVVTCNFIVSLRPSLMNCKNLAIRSHSQRGSFLYFFNVWNYIHFTLTLLK